MKTTRGNTKFAESEHSSFVFFIFSYFLHFAAGSSYLAAFLCFRKYSTMVKKTLPAEYKGWRVHRCPFRSLFKTKTPC